MRVRALAAVWVIVRRSQAAQTCGTNDVNREVLPMSRLINRTHWMRTKVCEIMFLHVAKTGGAIGPKRIEAHAGETIESLLHIKKNHSLGVQRDASHAPDCTLRVSTARNPWSRMVSWYSYCNEDYHGMNSQYKGLLPSPKKVCHNARLQPFSRWLQWLFGVALNGTSSSNAGNKPAMKDYERHYFAQCSDYMLDGQCNRAVDYIINFEEYESDVRYLLDYVGGHDYPKAPHDELAARTSIPVVNPSTHAHFSEFFKDDPVANGLIEDHFERDIRLFGFSMDDKV